MSMFYTSSAAGLSHFSLPAWFTREIQELEGEGKGWLRPHVKQLPLACNLCCIRGSGEMIQLLALCFSIQFSVLSVHISFSFCETSLSPHSHVRPSASVSSCQPTFHTHSLSRKLFAKPVRKCIHLPNPAPQSMLFAERILLR